MLCRMVEVSASGYYAWCLRPHSAQHQRDVLLTAHVRSIHAANRGVYGSPRVFKELEAQEIHTSKKRVARLMRNCGISGVRPKRFVHTTNSAHGLPIAQNVVARHFSVDEPNAVWVTDMTYVRTWEGWLYVAVILDLFSRKVIGWAASDCIDTNLALTALDMAVAQRMPPRDLVHHSDRGCQYASLEYQQALKRRAFTCSMSRKGNCWDNAVAESFFATLKTELIYRRAWPHRQTAISAIGEYIEVFYNRQRRHSTLGYVSPAQFEAVYNHAALAA